MIEFIPTTQQVKDVSVLTYKGHTQLSIVTHTGMSLENVRKCQQIAIESPFGKTHKGYTEWQIQIIERDLYKLIPKIQDGTASFKEIDEYKDLKYRYAHSLMI